jgi:hypothetical protein
MDFCRMNFIEALLMWAESLQVWLVKQDIALKFGQSPNDRLTRSCWLNVRRGDREAEILLWESGEAEFDFGGGQRAGATQEHHEFERISDLGVVLARLLTVLGESGASHA